jgi:hypothetical protein
MTRDELEESGLPATWDEDFMHDLQECGEKERGEVIEMLLLPDFVWKNMESDCSDVHWIARLWYWFKAIISLTLDYEVHLWAQDNVVVNYWDMRACQFEYSGYDWRELVVRPGWKLGYDIYNNSSY